MPTPPNPASNQLKLVVLNATQIIVFIAAWKLAVHFSPTSPFVVHSQIQYGQLILSLYIAVLAATGWGCMLGAAMEDSRGVARLLRMGSLIPLGVVGVMLWTNSFRESAFDTFGIWLAIFAFLGFAASAADGGLSPEYLGVTRSQLLFLELPLFISAATVVSIKYIWYHQSTDAFNTFLVTRLIGEWKLPDKGAEIRELLEWMRLNFWHGMTSGVLIVQMISVQLVGLVLRVSQLAMKTSRPAA